MSPYGYSGPVETPETYNPPDWANFLLDFHDSCGSDNIITEFARLHPFETNIYNLMGEPIHYEREVYYVDLTQTTQQIWDGFDKGCKHAIRKCESATVRLDGVDRQFRELYAKAMTAKGANQYVFDDAFFEKLAPMVTAFYCGGSAALFLKHGKYCHYFLSATDPDRRSMGHGNLILWEAMQWAKDSGCRVFVLGGGLRANDSLESFKRSFTKTSKPFYTLRKVHNRKAYDEVCRLREIYESNYFPAYRSWE